MELRDSYARFKELGAEIIAISTDSEADARAAVDQLQLGYPVLYDTDHTVSEEWKVFNLLDDGVAAPATFLFDGVGDLVAHKIGGDIADRPSAQEVIAVIEAAE